VVVETEMARAPAEDSIGDAKSSTIANTINSTDISPKCSGRYQPEPYRPFSTRNYSHLIPVTVFMPGIVHGLME
jgi:hypothetical protein